MKRFSYFFSFAAIFAAFFFSLQSCQKEAANAAIDSVKPNMTGEDRSPTGIVYGVTLYDGVNPCRIVGMDQNTGLVVSTVTAFYTDPNGVNIPLENLKGICLTDLGQPFGVKAHFLTTGNPANPSLPAGSPYNDGLFKVDPTTGQCSFASTSTLSTVSDLEYEPNLGVFYGLRSNNNNLVTIADINNNWSTYSGVPINGIAAGYRLKGLSLVRDIDANGLYLVGCATSGNALDPAQLYRIQPGVFAATATFMTNLNPVTSFSTGHCAIGFDRDINQLSINRSNVLGGFGLNRLPWSVPLPNPANTGFWGAAGINFEDLTSSVY